jgi:hypothetical protein
MAVSCRISRHAEARARQRGITTAQIAAVLEYGDRSRVGRDGVEVLSLSARFRRALGPATPEGVDTGRLANLYVLVSGDGCVVTNYRGIRHC